MTRAAAYNRGVPTAPSRTLQVVPNPHPDRDYEVAMTVPEFTCLVGTMVQETYGSHPGIRDACARSIFGHAAQVEADIRAAVEAHGLAPPWTAASLALYTQAVLQGAFILAKAQGSAEPAAQCVDHLRRTVELLFNRSPSGSQEKETAP